MKHRIFYGSDFKLNDSDKKMFSRDGYECKAYCRGSLECQWQYHRKWTRIFQYGKCSMDFRVWYFRLMKMQWTFAEGDSQE